MKNTSFFRLSLLSVACVSLMACASTEKHETTAATPAAAIPQDPKELGRQAIEKMAGCYIVDYSYAETEALKKGYKLDGRVYDVNKNKTVKEWIYTEDVSPNRVRLQHVMFFIDKDGKKVAGSELKHNAQDWEYAAPYVYDFSAPNTWDVKTLDTGAKTWTRRITNLDDGLRYQCAASWTGTVLPIEWTCENYAPIPGRETRDMKRKDYQTLARQTRLLVYGDSWLERQENVKTIHDAKGKTPLAKEVGKNWYVRIPDSECTEIQAWAKPQQDFWKLLRETWDQELNGKATVVEAIPAGQPPRFMKMGEVETKYTSQDLKNPTIREQARTEILQVIAAYKKPATESVKK